MKDISTAPRDGTPIQGWNDDGWVPIMHWHKRYYNWRDGSYGRWAYGEGCGIYFGIDYLSSEPTHWEHVPTGP